MIEIYKDLKSLNLHNMIEDNTVNELSNFDIVIGIRPFIELVEGVDYVELK